MAQEAGRKAAHWIRQENAKLFQHKEVDPSVPAFIPTMVYNEESQMEVTDLEKLMRNVDVKDAVLVYNLLKKNNIDVRPELKPSLMGLLCIFNYEESLAEEYIEERWFQQGVAEKGRQKKTWKNFELAEQIFHEIEDKKAEHYCAVIRGMAKSQDTLFFVTAMDACCKHLHDQDLTKLVNNRCISRITIISLEIPTKNQSTTATSSPYSATPNSDGLLIT